MIIMNTKINKDDLNPVDSMKRSAISFVVDERDVAVDSSVIAAGLDNLGVLAKNKRLDKDSNSCGDLGMGVV